MKIVVVGAGYVGLVSGTCYAESGNEVVCVDIDSKRIASLNEGKVPIYEPGLQELVRRNLKEGRLRFSVDVAEAVQDASVTFIAVGTPMSTNGAANLESVFKAAEDVVKAAVGYHVIAVKSTVPVETNDKMREIVARLGRKDIDVCSVPEFLKEGSAVEDFMRPISDYRQHVGRATAILREIHALLRTDNPLLVMDPVAELAKYASNAMPRRVSFINQIAPGARWSAPTFPRCRGMGADRRIGSQFLFPGVGYGGSCFPRTCRH